MRSIEQALPFLATWGAWIFAAALLLALLATWRLGRGQRLRIPSTWPGRIASALMLSAAALCAIALFGILGPMRPMLDQVRGLGRTVGRPAGELAFRRVDDDRLVRLSELRGQVVLLNLWATWCPPCRKELPEIDRLQRDYRQRGLVVVTLSNEERARLSEYARQYPVGTLNAYTAALGWLDVGGRPVSLVIDRSGVVRASIIGARGYAEFERAVARHLAKT